MSESQVASPRVSVVMPVYNSEKWLSQAIDSILHQTFSDFEFIVVDDGSTDGSRHVVMEAARNDPRILVAHQDHLGVTAALNRGIALARSPVVARMDADDVSHPDRLQTQLRFLEKHPRVAALGAWAWLIDNEGRKIGELRPKTEPAAIHSILTRRNPFVHASMMMSTEAIRTLGGYRAALDGAEDYDLWLRMSERAPLANLPEFLISHRRHLASASAAANTKQLLAARLARMSATSRRVSRADFADGLGVPINVETLGAHEELQATADFYGRLGQSPDEHIAVKDLRCFASSALDHAERKAGQLWLNELLKKNKSWSIRWPALFWLFYLHPPRAVSLVWSMFKADRAPE